jgi:hypothetical protein
MTSREYDIKTKIFRNKEEYFRDLVIFLYSYIKL